MFEFLRRRRPNDQTDPLATPKAAADWFRRLPARDVIGRQQHVVSAFDDMMRAGKTIDHDRIAAVEWLDAAMVADSKELIRQYADSTARPGALAERIWQAAYDLSTAFTRAYKRILEAAFASPKESQWKRALPRLVARLMHFYSMDAKLRVLHGERWIPAKFAELHRLYLKAAELGVERAPVTAVAAETGAAPRTVEQEYIAVLLTHLLNMGTLTPAEIDWAGAQLRAWCAGLALEPSPRAGGGFCVDLSSKMGLFRCAESDGGKTVRYVDSTRIVEKMEHGIAELDLSKNDEPDATGLRRHQRIAVLEKLKTAFGHEEQSAPYRHPRITMSLPADVRIGLADVTAHLAAKGDAEDAFESTAVQSIDDVAADVVKEKEALGGNPRKDRSRPAVKAPASSWKLEDRSTTGLRLSATGVNGRGVALGALIAVREAQTGSNWGLGVVRRINRSDKTLDLGVALLATDFVRVGLHAKRHAREDMGFVVDGIDVSTIGTRFSGLYLPPPSRPENPVSMKTLIIPTSEYAHGRSVVLITARSVYTVALHKAFEQRPEWTWAAIDIVSKTPRD